MAKRTELERPSARQRIDELTTERREITDTTSMTV